MPEARYQPGTLTLCTAGNSCLPPAAIEFSDFQSAVSVTVGGVYVLSASIPWPLQPGGLAARRRVRIAVIRNLIVQIATK